MMWLGGTIFNEQQSWRLSQHSSCTQPIPLRTRSSTQLFQLFCLRRHVPFNGSCIFPTRFRRRIGRPVGLAKPAADFDDSLAGSSLVKGNILPSVPCMRVPAEASCTRELESLIGWQDATSIFSKSQRGDLVQRCSDLGEGYCCELWSQLSDFPL